MASRSGYLLKSQDRSSFLTAQIDDHSAESHFPFPASAETEKLQPVGIQIDKDRKWAYVALGPANRIAVMDAQTLDIKDYWLVGQRVWNITFGPEEKYLYAANGVSNVDN